MMFEHVLLLFVIPQEAHQNLQNRRLPECSLLLNLAWTKGVDIFALPPGIVLHLVFQRAVDYDIPIFWTPWPPNSIGMPSKVVWCQRPASTTSDGMIVSWLMQTSFGSKMTSAFIWGSKESLELPLVTPRLKTQERNLPHFSDFFAAPFSSCNLSASVKCCPFYAHHHISTK